MSPELASLLRILAAVGLMLMNGVILIYMLRRVLGRLHQRLGPVHVGPQGLLQTPMDVLKLLTKEDITPTNVDKALYFIAPAAVFTPSLMAYAAIPFSPTWMVTDLDTGLLYTLVVMSLVSMGLLMAGWASANKWSLIGGMRSVGQHIAYEIPLLLSVLPVVMYVGTLNLSSIVEAQSGTWLGILPQWFITNPLFWPAFIIFIVSALIKVNQTPFDMSEAESELVAGFATEYSSMKFGLFFLSEFSNSFIVSALAVTLFFGGWTLPFVPDEVLAPIAPVVFMLKVYVGIFVLMWIRGTLPRVRMDHLMQFAWKILIPAVLTWILVFGFIIKLFDLGRPVG
ncbi:MAG: NADH-quinone oxidoreductase subunit NuoH [Actinobacteria bacterium]|nr:NADH-quinone oxidoreductase subunit NuoH [Actinomycetota bacterium]MCL5888082.1 NADH-quinone oxidoreductase subunit NuoH [Actinomycetota bacterium]